MALDRCVGCQWRTPQRFGGQGIICTENNGTCPDWAIEWTKNWLFKGMEPTAEQLMEANRL